METFNFKDVEQNTDEWFLLRSGKLTSSKMGTVMAKYGQSFGEPAKKYAVNIAIEQITGNAISSNYTNDHMQRGHDQEPVARMIYEDLFFCDVTNGGFFESEFVGCSPDGLVDTDGLIEIKSVISSIHFANIKRQDLDPAYKWQCIANLYFTGRQWIDFVSYCEDFPEGKNLFVKRLHAKDLANEFDMINTRILEFKKLVESTKQLILNNKYVI